MCLSYGLGKGCGGNLMGSSMNPGTSIGIPFFQSGSIPSSWSGKSIGVSKRFVIPGVIGARSILRSRTCFTFSAA